MKATLTLPASLKTMLEDLAKLEKDGVDAAAREMIEAGAEVALEGMRKRVPVRKVKGGRLKSHLRRSAIKGDGNRVYTEVGLIGAPAEVVRYGTAQEFGTSRHAAQSYLRPTMKEDRAKIYRAMRNVLKQRLGE
ncbi:MAG: HK97-gp10 family putative phage morphogenesis protein [Anaerolineaceae bacterium]|jgi:HK97 gp10 family phage protein